MQVTHGPARLTGYGLRPRPPTRRRFRGLQVQAALRPATSFVAERLSRLTHRAGAWLFADCDAEAGWHNWQVTELRGGLARSYRDGRFDLLPLLRSFEEQATDAPDAPPPMDPPGTGNRSWDDVHGWPWNGEG